MKAVVFTLGCKVNSRESACLITGLKARGYETSDKLGPADIYIINTCAVTAEAEKKSRQAVARALKFNKEAKIFICGCASQKNPNVFREKGARVVVGARAKDKILDYLDCEGVFIEESDEYYEKYFPDNGLKTREYIKIQDGCDNYCSYCIIPYLRGRSRSRKIEKIVEEIKLLNPIEAVITGINVSAFDDDGKRLPQLISALKEFDCRFRFGSLEVCSITKELLEETKKLKDFAPHFHLSLQSGSDNVLKAMNRHYTADEFASKVDLIRKFYPNAAITTDIIVGYSAETEENFEETLNFCDRIAFADIHCFPYSVREGTEGAKLKKISDDIKRIRLEKLMEKKKVLKQKYVNQYIGATLTFIPEEEINGYTVGYSENYIRIYIKGCVPSSKIKVKILENYQDGMLAEVIV
ncbi:MAG: MiaB/RimO family radical SAM methylthiotransferase [Clostridia bacterium]|nr:MiaB/RimO family radical SAM methylthiotransferase [Clostridia bacterium]